MGPWGLCSWRWIFTLSELGSTGGLGAEERQELTEHLKRLTLATIWKPNTDGQAKKQGDPLGGYCSLQGLLTASQPRKHQSQEAGVAPTHCQKTQAQSVLSSQTSWRCWERRACITILASSKTGRTPRSNQYWIHSDLICTCLRIGWASMKQHHLVGLLKVCSRTRSPRPPYTSPGSEAGSPGVLTQMQVRTSLGSEKDVWRKEGVPFPNPHAK